MTEARNLRVDHIGTVAKAPDGPVHQIQNVQERFQNGSRAPRLVTGYLHEFVWCRGVLIAALLAPSDWLLDSAGS